LAALPFVQARPGPRRTSQQADDPRRAVPGGGPADIFGRNLAERMSPLLGQPVLVENKSGAAGVTGIDFVAKAAPMPTSWA
jgi:tripartite-type tricarboxylate transporter receptor subunit TctC